MESGISASNPRLFSFVGGELGPWKVVSTSTLSGASLPSVSRLEVTAGMGEERPSQEEWILRGVTSNERYVTREEKQKLLSIQPALGRPEADCAVLIPIKKNAAWWAFTQDERRQIFESSSNHTKIGLEYLPAVARRLHHCRDLATQEPFDFLTWFEFASDATPDFDKLLSRLRSSEEWTYVERECEIRLKKES